MELIDEVEEVTNQERIINGFRIVIGNLDGMDLPRHHGRVLLSSEIKGMGQEDILRELYLGIVRLGKLCGYDSAFVNSPKLYEENKIYLDALFYKTN